MTRENKIEFLKRAKKLKNYVDILEEELNFLYDLKQKLDKMGVKGPKIDFIADTIVQIDKQQNKLKIQISELLSIRAEIYQTINNLDNQDERVVLILRYLDLLSWETIAEKLSYSRAQIFRLRDKAIENLEIVKDETF